MSLSFSCNRIRHLIFKLFTSYERSDTIDGMKKFMLLALLPALTLASCGTQQVAPQSSEFPAQSVAAQALAFEANPKALSAQGLSAQALTKTVGLTGLSSTNAECANLYVTVVGSTVTDPLAAYYGMSVKSTPVGTGYQANVKSLAFPIDSAHDWNVTLECRDPRNPSNHSASSFSLWRASYGDAGFLNAPTRYVVSRSSEQPYWAGYGATKQVQTFQGSYSPDAPYGERNRPRAGSN